MKLATPTPSPPARAARSRRIPARKVPQTPDALFLALLRRKCMRAASVGALTAAGEAIPGLFRVVGLVFGELVDAQFLARIQRELVEETFALYGLKLPARLHNALVNKVQFIGTGASVAGDALARAGIKRLLGRAGGMVAARVLPLTAIATSALSNVAVTYAIGKRAQAVARLRDAPIRAMPDVVRAFTGIDERRIYAWSVAAVKDAVGLLGRSFGRFAATSLRKGTKRFRTRG
ncbi:MAG: hypothetical protein P4L92_17725 [Rudaea sp.]|nr:hypothetical protein [Rudaea sp.]